MYIKDDFDTWVHELFKNIVTIVNGRNFKAGNRISYYSSVRGICIKARRKKEEKKKKDGKELNEGEFFKVFF